LGLRVKLQIREEINNMKKNLTKVVSLILVVALTCSGAWFTFAKAETTKNNEKAENIDSEKTAEENELDDKNDGTATGEVDFDINKLFDVEDVDKEETVYVIAGADGSVEKVIVSELLKNPDGADKIFDITKLRSLENVKSDATYELSGESCVWNADGESIYYRGTTEEEVPVTFTISFKS